MTVRRTMTLARKSRIHDSRGGVCWICRRPVPVTGDEVIYDHRVPLDFVGVDEDGDIWPIHASPCNKLKTREDQRSIAKARRIRKRLAEPLPPGRIPRRQFSKKRLQGQPGRTDVRLRSSTQGASS